jgi:hypothetical protein
MTDKKDMAKPYYSYTLSELIDRLTIVQLKETYNPELKEQYAKEIEDLVHDINLALPKSVNGMAVTGEFLRDVIILAQYNHHIWINEDEARKAKLDDNPDYEKLYKQLRLTHSLNNGVRNPAKTKLQSLVGGRTELKNNTLSAEDCKDWLPSGYF